MQILNITFKNLTNEKSTSNNLLTYFENVKFLKNANI